MSRRPGNPRRFADGGGLPFAGVLNSKSRSSPLLSVMLLLVVCVNFYFAVNDFGVSFLILDF